MKWAGSLGGYTLKVAPVCNTGRSKDYQMKRILSASERSLLAAVHLLRCEWGSCVRDVEWERHSVSLHVWVSELCLWAEPLQTMNFIVYISSCSWVCPWKPCSRWQCACRASVQRPRPRTLSLPCTWLQRSALEPEILSTPRHKLQRQVQCRQP